MKNDNENKPSCLLLFLLFMIAVVVGTIVNGWVLSILWGWFVVPLFNLAPLTIPYAIGISTIFSMFIRRPESSKNDKKYENDDLTKIIESIGYALFSPFVVLFVAYIVTLFL